MGRPRSFDLDEALDRAVLVFWQLGYDRATIDDLTKAMGINRPSLYAAFGDKEELFRRAVDRYANGPGAYEDAALELASAREVAEALLRGAVERQTGRRTPHGCLAVLGAHAWTPEGGVLRSARRTGERAARERFVRARREGDLPPDDDPKELAHFVHTVIYGLTVQAASGASRAELDRVVDRAMRAWPE